MRMNGTTSTHSPFTCSLWSVNGEPGHLAYHDAARVIELVLVNDSVSRISLELAPTKIWKSPAGMTHFCSTTSHTLKSLFLSVILNEALDPLSMEAFEKPRRTLGGSPTLAGKPRYTWATSAPSTPPVFFTLKETESASS